MVPLKTPYPGVYIDTFIFFLRSLCKIIWMNVHYFPNAPRTCTPTDRPKSVRNRCVIELFVASFVLSPCSFDISADVRAFVIGLSQISAFFSGIKSVQRILRFSELLKVYESKEIKVY